jgi:hypothetical protein
VSKPVLKFTADDAVRASDEWGANCGPAALAAVLGKSIDDVRLMIPCFDVKHYTNPTMMIAALRASGRRFHRVPHDEYLPMWGVLRIQWGGPWMRPEVPERARYGYTHWIAVSNCADGSEWAFDINCISVGGWVTWREWCDVTVPYIIRNGVPRGDGSWSITHAFEVSQ